MFCEPTEFPFSEAKVLMMFGTDVCNLEYQLSHKTWAGESLFFLGFFVSCRDVDDSGLGTGNYMCVKVMSEGLD